MLYEVITFSRFASAWASVDGFRSIVWAAPADEADWLSGGGGSLRPVYRVPTLDSDAELAWLGSPAVRAAIAGARVSGRMGRITSYNVCYTKLLRP